MNKFKQLFTLLVVSLCTVQSAWADVEINETNFPDENFRNWLISQSYGSDGVITTEEIAAITYLFVAYEKIETLEGIEHFTALTKISCQENLLTSLDVSKNTALTSITCYNNQLTSLDVSKNTSLTYLDCHKNKLTSLDLSNNTALTNLNCRSNQLTSLDVSKNTALTDLNCRSNQLTSLDVSKNTALTSLSCDHNQLTSLDVSKNTALTSLSCDHNQLTSLDVSKNTALTNLNCGSNLLTSLDVSKNTALTSLSCDHNQLTSLDVSKNTALTSLSCDHNQLTSLDVSKNTVLTSLYCDGNQLTSIDVSNNTALTRLSCGYNQLTTFDVSKNTVLTSLYCNGNQLTSLDVSKNTALTTLDCSGNQLTSLDVSQNTELQNLNFYSNNIKGVAMDALIASLPQSTHGFMYVVYSENEGNEMSKAQVEAAKAKGWTPMYYNGSSWEEYAGSESTAEADIDGLHYKLNFKEFTASVMPSSSLNTTYENYTWEQITIPEQVTFEGKQFVVNEICSSAFTRCLYLTSVTIPSTVSTIGQYAFSNCIDLTSITIPNSVTSIGYRTFQNCSHLTDVTLPDGLTEIPEYMFYCCTSLVNITIPSSVTNIGERAFAESHLESLSLPTSLQSIGNYAFRYCFELKSVILPQELKSIGEGAFEYCPFSQVFIPASVTYIGANAFYGVQQSFSVDGASTSFSSYNDVLYNKEQTTLMQAPALITTHSLAATTRVIEKQAFYGCQNLTSVTLPEGLTTIYNYAFAYTPQLATIKLPESLTYLDGVAFAMSGISGEVTIPAAVENIESAFAFRDCVNLQAIHVAEGNSVLSSDRGVVYNKQKTQLMYMPLGFEGDYSIVPGTESIGYFQYNEEWKDFDYFAGIRGCLKLTSLHIPASVNNIVRGSIRQNASLSSITVDETSPYFQVSDGALYDKDMKTLYWVADTREGSFVVPDGVEYLTEEVFRYASGLKQVTIPASVEKMGSEVFNNFTLEGITWLREEPLVVEYVPVENNYKWRYASSLNNCFYFRRTNVDSWEMEYATCPLYVPEGSVANYQADARWSAVFNDILPIGATGVVEAKTERYATTPESYYSLDGKNLSKPQRGLNIVRMSNGTTRKVVVK